MSRRPGEDGGFAARVPCLEGHWRRRMIHYATSVLERLLGTPVPACFLAGGAFKSLIHGRPPRDFDLWAESEDARAHLVARLGERGEKRPTGPAAERFVIRRERVEVSLRVETMESRLARFDLGLASLAVVFRDGAEPSAFVHPLALESVARREVLLVRLLRGELALATLLRARKYATDLGYRVPEGVEARLWAVHLGLGPEERRAQVEALRFHYPEGDYGVAEEAQERWEEGAGAAGGGGRRGG